MSWYDEDLKYRWPVVLDNVTNATTTEDAQFTIPPSFDLFWDNVLATGADVVICDENGNTLAVFQLSSWTYATKTGVVQVDGANVPANGEGTVWLYWGDAAHVSEAGTFTAVTPIAGTIFEGGPGEIRVEMIHESQGATVPSQSVTKVSSETTRVWMRVADVLIRRRFQSQGSDRLEEVGRITNVRADQGGAEVTTIGIQNTYAVLDEAGDTWLGLDIRAGTDANQYVIRCQITTAGAGGRNLEGRVLLYVQDPDES